eukprot:CFRG1112T1
MASSASVKKVYATIPEVTQATATWVAGLKPPSETRGMKVLDRSKFATTVTVKALRVAAKDCSGFVKAIRPALLNMPRMRNIIADPETQTNKTVRLVLLSPVVNELSQLPTEMQSYISARETSIVSHTLPLSYEYWSGSDVLSAILPQGSDEGTVSGFETIGHIAHFNLRESYLPFRNIIGDVIIDKNPHIKTVVNKLGSIDTTFRFFKMEVIAGEENFFTEVKESGCTFQFDYSKVYWNSKLSTEHGRLLNTFSKNDVICDMMAGVGPTVIPACKRGNIVYGNDLNPDSYAAMVTNASNNKLKAGRFHLFNKCARQFVRDLVAGYEHTETPVVPFTQVIMNLPASAIEFLDVFVGLFAYSKIKPESLPLIHCYCFSSDPDPTKDIRQRIETVVKYKFKSDDGLSIYDVRDVAPLKRMYCATFPLPPEVAFNPQNVSASVKRSSESGDVDERKESQSKKAKHETIV